MSQVQISFIFYNFAVMNTKSQMEAVRGTISRPIYEAKSKDFTISHSLLFSQRKLTKLLSIIFYVHIFLASLSTSEDKRHFRLSSLA